MRRYEIHYDPIAHMIFYDIFTPNQRRILLDCFKKIDYKFKEGDLIKSGKIEIDYEIKNNYNFWPYDRRDIKESNIIIDMIENLVWSDDMRKIYKQIKDSLFLFYHHTDLSEILISRYHKNSFYDWHRDLSRRITLNFWLSDDYVDGGDFELNYDGIIKTIEYSDNTMIAFPSECLHRVTKIKNDCTRYSIQYFATFRMRKAI